VYIADAAVANELARPPEVVLGALLAAGQPYNAVFFHCIANRPALGDVVSERFLAVNVLSGAGGHDCRYCVPVVRRCNTYRVDIMSRNDFTKIIAGGAIFVSVRFIDNTGGVITAFCIDVADGGDLYLRLLEESPHVAGAFAARRHR